MVPFDVKINGKKVGISWESLFWFFVVTAGATVLGELVYDKYVQPYLADLPNLPFGTPSTSVASAALPPSNVVSTQTPSLGAMRRARTRG